VVKALSERFRLRRRPAPARPYSAGDAAQYYEDFTETYLEAGDFIQAYRTSDTDALMAYLSSSIGLQDGMHLLDAGCGVAAPAVWIARQFPQTRITCVSNSAKQCEIARQRVLAAGLQARIRLVEGDYHCLPDLCPPQAFDRVMFIESLGHHQDLPAVLRGVSHALKPGGAVYVKDFFRRHSRDPAVLADIELAISTINSAYAYNVLTLRTLLATLFDSGFSLDYVRPLGLDADLELTIAFEHRAGRLTYPTFKAVRAVDWFEILATRD
jgi:ubiquinone/menaquinone biosynthesis C-methylase UbiE